MNAAAETTKVETRQFEAEVAQVLHLVTHSLYSHKEIFLRELISNASDALDKLRFESLKDANLAETELRIEIQFDQGAKTLRIRDYGIGMSRDEVIENIGTIARSGTRKFLEALSLDQKADANLIGQFGVGFYSAFVVADQVSLTTRRAGSKVEDAVRWGSDGTGQYTIENANLAEAGTEIVLHLKDSEGEFLSDWRLRDLIHRYSDHVAFPIRMQKSKPNTQSASETDAEVDTDASAQTQAQTSEWETINQAAAIWTRAKTDLTDEDYQGFYKHLAHEDETPLSWTHNKVEGNQNYSLLLYLPKKSPWDVAWSSREERKGLKLYVRRVFIMDASEQLLPNYLRFIKGVVDSDDLPLNVSREILQENQLTAKIRAACVKRSLDMIEKISTDNADDYQKFFNEFGEVLKEGVAEDYANRERLLKLMRFASTHSGSADKTTSLSDYLARMKTNQTEIFYVSAESYAAAVNSPQLEALRARNVEVILMFDRIDEWMMQSVFEFEGKPIRNVAKGELDLNLLGEPVDQAESKKIDEENPDAVALIARIEKALGERVGAVRASKRLTESASCLIREKHDMAGHLEKLLKQAGHEIPKSKPTLEVNLNHSLVQRVQAANEEQLNDLAVLLFEQAQLAEGAQLEDPIAFVKRMNRLIAAK